MRISVTDTLAQAAASIREHFKYFLGVAFFFFALGVLWQLIVAGMVAAVVSSLGILGFYLVAIVSSLVGLALYVKPAVMVHRTVILKETKNWNRMFSWGKPETHLFLLCLGLWIIFMLSSMLFGMMFAAFSNNEVVSHQFEYGFVLIMMVLGGAVFSQIALMLPAFAVGHKVSVGDSIDLTRGQSLKVFLLVVVLPVLISMLMQYVIPRQSSVIAILLNFLTHLLVIFEVSVLSHVYLRLTENSESGDQANKESAADDSFTGA